MDSEERRISDRGKAERATIPRVRGEGDIKQARKQRQGNAPRRYGVLSGKKDRVLISGRTWSYDLHTG